MRYLGIDYGSKRIGLALSDEEGYFAYPLAVVPNGAKALGRIKIICADRAVGGIVLGESLNYRRQHNLIMKAILRFKRQLESDLGLPVTLQDEALTTREASRVTGLPRGRDALLDARAAAIILKTYLDRRALNHDR